MQNMFPNFGLLLQWPDLNIKVVQWYACFWQNMFLYFLVLIKHWIMFMINNLLSCNRSNINVIWTCSCLHSTLLHVSFFIHSYEPSSLISLFVIFIFDINLIYCGPLYSPPSSFYRPFYYFPNNANLSSSNQLHFLSLIQCNNYFFHLPFLISTVLFLTIYVHFLWCILLQVHISKLFR